MLSLFFQVTVAPTVTVIVAGVKAILIMLTELGAAGELLPVPLLLLEQETNIVENSKTKLTTLAILFFIVFILNYKLKMITYALHL